MVSLHVAGAEVLGRQVRAARAISGSLMRPEEQLLDVQQQKPPWSDRALLRLRRPC